MLQLNNFLFQFIYICITCQADYTSLWQGGWIFKYGDFFSFYSIVLPYCKHLQLCIYYLQVSKSSYHNQWELILINKDIITLYHLLGVRTMQEQHMQLVTVLKSKMLAFFV